MSVQVDTLSLTIPGHVVRKNTEGDSTTLVLTAAQAAFVYESLGRVSPLFSEYLTSSPDFVVPAAELEPEGVKPLASVKAASPTE